MNQRKTTRRVRARPRVIVVVDDNELLGKFAAEVLRMEGHTVQVFTNPAVALKKIQEAATKPIALVTDYEMGNMNGLDLIGAAHKICPALRTILLSGSVDASIILSRRTKVDRFIAKPYQPAQLTSAVTELLGDPAFHGASTPPKASRGSGGLRRA